MEASQLPGSDVEAIRVYARNVEVCSDGKYLFLEELLDMAKLRALSQGSNAYKEYCACIEQFLGKLGFTFDVAHTCSKGGKALFKADENIVRILDFHTHCVQCLTGKKEGRDALVMNDLHKELRTLGGLPVGLLPQNFQRMREAEKKRILSFINDYFCGEITAAQGLYRFFIKAPVSHSGSEDL